jgi:hypothetical protein
MTNRTLAKTVGLEQQKDRILAKLVELGVNEKWLIESGLTAQGARDLLKGLLYLKELYPNTLRD